MYDIKTTFKIIKGRQPPVRFDLHTNIPYAVQNFGIWRLKYLIVCLINCSSINDQSTTLLNNHWYFNQRQDISFILYRRFGKIFKIIPAQSILSWPFLCSVTDKELLRCCSLCASWVWHFHKRSIFSAISVFDITQNQRTASPIIEVVPHMRETQIFISYDFLEQNRITSRKYGTNLVE